MRKKRDKTSQLVRRGESPEEALFRNVITQALQDATMRLPDYRSVQLQTAQIIRGQARRWFKLQTDDFKAVCALAGLEAQRVHKFAMTRIRESIERENAKTAEFLTSAMPGVGSNFQMVAQDRPTSDPRESAEIGFLNLDENPSRDESLSIRAM